MILRSIFVALLLLVATRCHAQGADIALRRWAVIASPEIRERGLSDLLTAALSKQADLELVEREQLDVATKELELSTVLGSKDTTRRLKLGQLVRADALVLLSLVTREKKSFLKLVISDSIYGARLRTEYFANDPAEIVSITQACEEAIAETRRQFAGGIKNLIGVTHFLSKNLSHDYDHLQTGYAELLANALSAHAGVAVLEIEEARAIAAELNLTARELKGRVVPLFVEGDFEIIKKEGQAEPLVQMVVRLTDGGQVQRKGERRDLTQSQCVDLLTVDFPPRLLQISGDDKTVVVGRERQREIFTKRANTFSELGAFEHATALREAALLLHPDDHEQRMNLIVDYYQWREAINGTRRYTTSKLEAKTKSSDGLEAIWKEYVDQSHSALHHMSYHALELVHRRGINIREASLLLFSVAHTAAILPHASRGDRVDRNWNVARILFLADGGCDASSGRTPPQRNTRASFATRNIRTVWY